MDPIYLSPRASVCVDIDALQQITQNQPIAILTKQELEDLRRRSSNTALAIFVAAILGFAIGKFWP